MLTCRKLVHNGYLKFRLFPKLKRSLPLFEICHLFPPVSNDLLCVNHGTLSAGWSGCRVSPKRLRSMMMTEVVVVAIVDDDDEDGAIDDRMTPKGSRLVMQSYQIFECYE